MKDTFSACWQTSWIQKVWTHVDNKKVLRERKRHTNHSVASTRYAGPAGGGGGVRGTPGGHPPAQGVSWADGRPCRAGAPLPGPPCQDGGYPPTWTWEGGTPPTWTWDGVPPLSGPGMGYHPPPPDM